MKLIIHRGTNEIGGTCVEVQSGSSKILVDFGMPLVDSSGNNFDFRRFEKQSVKELIDNGVLPRIPYAYNAEIGIDGVLISHAHGDHYGLLQYLSQDIPVFLGKATHEILKLNNVFLYQNNKILNPHYFEKNKSFRAGEFLVTAFWNDHSAFDSYSFLIEANGKRIFYSGDFRGHGRKDRAYKWFTHNAPKNVDCLLIEGTTIGRSTHRFKTENEIQTELHDVFKKSDCINYIYTSGQNIDRIVSIYKACLKAGKTFVVDVYTANVLHTLSDFARLPSPLRGYDNIKVLFPNRTTTGLFKRGLGDMANKFAMSKITKEQISANPSDYVVIVRPSMKNDLVKITASKGNLIYSMWDGYKQQSSTKEFIDWLASKNFKLIDIHTSGHADTETLKEFADSINPKTIIPIHTFNKQDYKTIFSQPIIKVDDNQTISI